MTKSAVVFFFSDRKPELPGWRQNKRALGEYIPSDPTSWRPGNRNWRQQALREVPHLIAMLYVASDTDGKARSDGDIGAIPEFERVYWAIEVARAYRARNGFGSGSVIDDLVTATPALGLADSDSRSGSRADPKRDGFRAATELAAKIIEQREDRLLRRYAVGRNVQFYVDEKYPSGRRVQFDAVERFTHGEALIEAKADETAESVRTAIGQVHDYLQVFKSVVRPMILLPGRPIDELLQLVLALGIALCFEEESGRFTTIEPTGILHRFVR